MKKIIALLITIMILLSFSIIVTSSFLPLAKLDISITMDGIVVTEAEIGDVIRVTVSMTDFPNLSVVVPSLHFNPRVVRVSDSAGNILPSAVRPMNEFFERGEAFQATGWGGIIPTQLTTHPFLNNETGLIGMFIEGPNFTSPSLVETQTIYSVYFLAVGAGNANIRLTGITDEHHDTVAFNSRGEPEYAIYNFVLNPSDPLNSTFDTLVNFTLPVFSVNLPESEAEIFKYDGTRVTDVSQLEEGTKIYASLDRTSVPNSARLILVVYDNDIFSAFDISSGDRTGYVTIPGDIRNIRIKVFVWDDINMMSPISKPLIIGGRN